MDKIDHQRRYPIGERLPAIDGREKVTGAAVFSNDLILPFMLCGKILRSPHAHARILSVDISRAAKLPGVKAVVTGQDTAAVKYGIFPYTRDQYLLPLDRVRYVGEEVAAVAAVDEDTALEALDLVAVEWEILPAVFDPEAALQEGAPQLHDDKPGNVSTEVRLEWGDVERAFAAAHLVREDRFRTEALGHATMEPYAAVANYLPSGRLEVWAPNQSPFAKRRGLANTLKLHVDDVHVRPIAIGGAFGARSEVCPAEFCAALLSRKSGRPVKITYTREENFIATRQKHPHVTRLRTGVRPDGTFLAHDIVVVADGGAYTSTGPMAMNVIPRGVAATYRVPNLRYHGTKAYTNKGARGAMKGHGSQQMRFALEQQLDMLAEELGIDPVEIRLRNALEPGEMLANGFRITSCGLKETIEKTAAAAGWAERRTRVESRGSSVESGELEVRTQPPAPSPQPLVPSGGTGAVTATGPHPSRPSTLDPRPSLGPRVRGIGVGCSVFRSGADLGMRSSSAAFVKLNEDAGVTVITGLIDNGQGNLSMVAQVAAAELGTRVEDVRVVGGDTAVAPNDPGTYTMTATSVSANAVQLAAADARRQLCAIAAEEMECHPEDLEVGEQRVFVRGSPERSMELRRVVWAGLSKGQVVLGRGSFMPERQPDGQMIIPQTYGTAIAEVEVDRESGQVQVVELTAAHDCGFAINPLRVEGQMDGDVAFAIGNALTEALRFEQGHVLNATLMDYGLCTALELPKVRNLIVESIEERGPYGAKEAAEAAGVAMLAAIVNAVRDAVGATFHALPITQEAILGALQSGRSEGVDGSV